MLDLLQFLLTETAILKQKIDRYLFAWKIWGIAFRDFEGIQ